MPRDSRQRAPGRRIACREGVRGGYFHFIQLDHHGDGDRVQEGMKLLGFMRPFSNSRRLDTLLLSGSLSASAVGSPSHPDRGAEDTSQPDDAIHCEPSVGERLTKKLSATIVPVKLANVCR
jgi:hypothetical protein